MAKIYATIALTIIIFLSMFASSMLGDLMG
jgi:hypothetical protein